MPDEEDTQCKSCNTSLMGQRFVRKDEQPHCIACYEKNFSNTCVKCAQKIRIDQKDLKHKDSHWHDSCFTCSSCQKSLVQESFVSQEAIAGNNQIAAELVAQLKPNDVFCSACYDKTFASKCDQCGNSFQAGSKKFEYRGKRYHDDCFKCAECQKNIGADKFVPRDESGTTVCCIPCYEEKYTKKCAECKKPIKQGGIMYRDQPWHKECFSCTKCQLLLAGQQFVTQEEKAYCLNCYGDLFAKKCTCCTKPIIGLNGYKFISFDESYYHSECFNCIKCSSNLVGKGFLMNEGAIVCPDCST